MTSAWSSKRTPNYIGARKKQTGPALPAYTAVTTPLRTVAARSLSMVPLGLRGLGGGLYYGAERVPASAPDPDVGTKFQSKDPLSRSVIRRNP